MLMRNAFVGQVGDPVVRFVVTDEFGARFIPGAKVAVVLEDGTFVTSKQADQGGNVAFGRNELMQALSRANISAAYADRAPVIWYTVEAPGYALQDGILFDPTDASAEQWKKIYTIALREGAPQAMSSNIAVPAAVVLGVGLVIALSA